MFEFLKFIFFLLSIYIIYGHNFKFNFSYIFIIKYYEINTYTYKIFF